MQVGLVTHIFLFILSLSLSHWKYSVFGSLSERYFRNFSWTHNIDCYYFRLFSSLPQLSNAASFYCNHYYYYYCYFYSLLSFFFFFSKRFLPRRRRPYTVCQFDVGVISNRILQTVLWRVRVPRINLVFAKLRLRYFNDRRHTTYRVIPFRKINSISVHSISRSYIIVDNNRFAYLI